MIAVYRDPFSFAPQRVASRNGMTIAEMAATIPDFPADGVVTINGHVVDRGVWHITRPKPSHPDRPVIVTFQAPVRGGDEGGGKQVLAIVASFAVMALSGFIGAGGLGGIFSAQSTALFGVSGLAASALGTGVALVGSLLIGALTAPPSGPNESGRDRERLGAASADGNVLEPNGPVPRVIGTHKIFPPLASEPFTYFDNQDEVVEAAYVLSGPHVIEDVRIGNAPIEDMTAVEYQVRDGSPGADPITMLTRHARTEATQTELRGHVVCGRAADPPHRDDARVAGRGDDPDHHAAGFEQKRFGHRSCARSVSRPHPSFR